MVSRCDGRMSFFKGLMVSSSLISFHDKLFVVKSESFE